MKAIHHRLRRLETRVHRVHRVEQGPSVADRILERRKRRLGPDYRPSPEFPAECYEGCKTIADRMIRTRQLRLKQEDEGILGPDERGPKQAAATRKAIGANQ